MVPYVLEKILRTVIVSAAKVALEHDPVVFSLKLSEYDAYVNITVVDVVS